MAADAGSLADGLPARRHALVARRGGGAGHTIGKPWPTGAGFGRGLHLIALPIALAGGRGGDPQARIGGCHISLARRGLPVETNDGCM